MRDRQDEALKFALGLGLLDAFTIGAESRGGAGRFNSTDRDCGVTKRKEEKKITQRRRVR